MIARRRVCRRGWSAAHLTRVVASRALACVFFALPLIPGATPAAAEHLLSTSPFLSGPAGPMVNPPGNPFEFCGVMEAGGTQYFGVRDTAHRHFIGWLRLNEPDSGVMVTAYNPRSEQITVKTGSAQLVLSLAAGARIGRSASGATAMAADTAANPSQNSEATPQGAPTATAAILLLSPEERQAHIAAVIERERRLAQEHAQAERQAVLNAAAR